MYTAKEIKLFLYKLKLFRILNVLTRKREWSKPIVACEVLKRTHSFLIALFSRTSVTFLWAKKWTNTTFEFGQPKFLMKLLMYKGIENKRQLEVQYPWMQLYSLTSLIAPLWTEPPFGIGFLTNLFTPLLSIFSSSVANRSQKHYSPAKWST